MIINSIVFEQGGGHGDKEKEKKRDGRERERAPTHISIIVQFLEHRDTIL